MSKIDNCVDITLWVKSSNLRVAEMLKLFKPNKNRVNSEIFVRRLLIEKCIYIQEIEESKNNNDITILDIADQIIIDRNGKHKVYDNDDNENKKIFKIMDSYELKIDLQFILIKKILDATKENLNQLDIEKCLGIIKALIKQNIPERILESINIIISYGFYENYIVTSYMIPAQIEYLLLKLFKDDGNNIDIYKDGNLTEEINNSSLLNNQFNKLKEIFERKKMDIEILYNLQYLFKRDNLRNDIYHGKCKDLELRNSTGMYLWYIFIYFLYNMCNNQNIK
jgi:hypothetical protein